MPVDWSRYPPDWKAISLRIRARDHWRCKVCGVPNGLRGWRDAHGRFRPLHSWEAPPPGICAVQIILTVAHIHDADPANCAETNLQALCQACHLYLDRFLHAAHAKATRATRRTVAQMTERVYQPTMEGL